MKKAVIFLVVCLGAAHGVVVKVGRGVSSSRGGVINWNGNNWALGCDFPGGDIGNVKITGADLSLKELFFHFLRD